VSLLILAGSVVSFEHDATWMATAVAGAVSGMLRGRQIAVETDQVWARCTRPWSTTRSSPPSALLAIAG
jgi:hypothetical protein